MTDRPKLDSQLDEKTFRSFYYLKEELVVNYNPIPPKFYF